MFNEEELKKVKVKALEEHPREDRRNLKRGKTKKNIRNRNSCRVFCKHIC